MDLRGSKDIFLQIIGRICVLINNLVDFAKKDRKIDANMSEKLDKTGRCISKAVPVKLILDKNGIIFADYKHSLAHSLWRSQEFSLFAKYKGYLREPVLDFGCGDGSFSFVLFDKIDYGVDHDSCALDIARDYNVYKKVGVSIEQLNIQGDTIHSVFSNSVLEHVSELEKTLGQIRLVIKTSGYFLFAVPTMQFTTHIKKYFGLKEAGKINGMFYHRNLLSKDEWEQLLIKNGFEIEKIIDYQPDWFTFLYRFLNTSVIGSFVFVFRRLLAICFPALMMDLIKNSIEKTANGANIFVIAKKHE